MIKLFKKLKTVAFAAVCVSFFIAFLCLYPEKENAKAANESVYLNIWQIDGFEGGKGSRAEYLQAVGNEFYKSENCYVSVVSLSAEAARLNLSDGNVPDLISYGAGMYGLESYVSGYTVWCRGGYCILTLDSSADFSDVKSDNTVINRGKDNFSSAAALLCGVAGAKAANPTAAYVKLINGDYKYLLGTQRDIFRLKTRGVAFAVKPVTAFNDLYQLISPVAQKDSCVYARKFIDYLLSKRDNLKKIGMLCDGVSLYDDEMRAMEDVRFDYRLSYPLNMDMRSSIEKSVSLGDINMLKELLK